MYRNPSERIKVITAIASQLSREEWDLIDLTLRQFELPWTDHWRDDRNGYVVTMIQDASEEQLGNLAKHLGLSAYASKSSISTQEIKDLIKQIELQKSLMIAVSTGGPRIQTVDEEYRERRSEISTALHQLGTEDPNPYSDLWSWYGKWSDGSLPTWQSRRHYISSLLQPLLDSLMLRLQTGEIQLPQEPTGWERVDRNVDKLVNGLATAKNEEDFQVVGLHCREALISVAQTVYDPTEHPSSDGVEISKTDAKRMLESYLTMKLAGRSNEVHRRFAKSAYQLAVALQHRRTANFRDAALCAEATRSVVNIIAIISGQRDP